MIKKIAPFVLISVVIYALGFASAKYFFVSTPSVGIAGAPSCPQTKTAVGDAKESACASAKADLRSKFIEATPFGRVNSSFALVKKTDDKGLVVEMDATKLFVLDVGKAERQILVSADIPVEQYKLRPQDEYQKEFEEFVSESNKFSKSLQEKVNKDKNFDYKTVTFPKPPERTTKTTLALKDVKVGDQVVVQTPSDLRLNEPAQATRILVVNGMTESDAQMFVMTLPPSGGSAPSDLIAPSSAVTTPLPSVLSPLLPADLAK